jgi:hypothetical protein
MSRDDDSLYPIAVLIDELRNEDVQVKKIKKGCKLFFNATAFAEILIFDLKLSSGLQASLEVETGNPIF